ncbi:unnamed protein product, partial [Allacma fusca]
MQYEPRDLKVVLNRNDVITKQGEEKKETALLDVGEIRRPTNYDPDTLQSDIAIIKLTTPVTYSDRVKPICYLMYRYHNTPTPSSTGTVPTSDDSRPGKTMTQGKNVDLIVLPEDECEAITTDSFCAKSSEGGIPCSDIGGAGLVFPVESDEDMLTYVLK